MLAIYIVMKLCFANNPGSLAYIEKKQSVRGVNSFEMADEHNRLRETSS